MKKTSTFKQIAGLLGMHLIMCLFMILVMVSVLSITSGIPVIQAAASVIIVLIYGRAVFVSSYDDARKDMKPYSTAKPYPAKGAVICLGVVAVTVLAWIYYVVAWKVAPITETSIPKMTIAANLIYSFVTSPFWAFVNVQGASANLVGQIAALVIPIAFSTIGYYCGYINWDYIKYFSRFVYDKKKK